MPCHHPPPRTGQCAGELGICFCLVCLHIGLEACHSNPFTTRCWSRGLRVLCSLTVAASDNNSHQVPLRCHRARGLGRSPIPRRHLPSTAAVLTHHRATRPLGSGMTCAREQKHCRGSGRRRYPTEPELEPTSSYYCRACCVMCPSARPPQTTLSAT